MHGVLASQLLCICLLLLAMCLFELRCCSVPCCMSSYLLLVGYVSTRRALVTMLIVDLTCANICPRTDKRATYYYIKKKNMARSHIYKHSPSTTATTPP